MSNLVFYQRPHATSALFLRDSRYLTDIIYLTSSVDISNIELSGIPLDEVKRKFKMPDFIANHPDWFDWA